MSRGVGCRHGLDPVLLWLWLRAAAVVPIRPLAWELPYAVSSALKRQKTKKKKKKKSQQKQILSQRVVGGIKLVNIVKCSEQYLVSR